MSPTVLTAIAMVAPSFPLPTWSLHPDSQQADPRRADQEAIQIPVKVLRIIR